MRTWTIVDLRRHPVMMDARFPSEAEPMLRDVERASNPLALVGVGKTRGPRDPLCSLYLTHIPEGIEVRCRDHRAGAWRKLRGGRVVTVVL